MKNHQMSINKIDNLIRMKNHMLITRCYLYQALKQRCGELRP